MHGAQQFYSHAREEARDPDAKGLLLAGSHCQLMCMGDAPFFCFFFFFFSLEPLFPINHILSGSQVSWRAFPGAWSLKRCISSDAYALHSRERVSTLSDDASLTPSPFMPQPRATPGFRCWLAGIWWTQFQCFSFVDPVPTTAPSYTFPGLYPAYSGKYVSTIGVDHWVRLVFTLVPLWCARKYVLRILVALNSQAFIYTGCRLWSRHARCLDDVMIVPQIWAPTLGNAQAVKGQRSCCSLHICLISPGSCLNLLAIYPILLRLLHPTDALSFVSFSCSDYFIKPPSYVPFPFQISRFLDRFFIFQFFLFF